MGLFNDLYAAGKNVVDELKKPLVCSSLKRKYVSAFEDAESKKIDLKKKLSELTSNFDNHDINAILEASMEIETLAEEQEILKKVYKELFDKEMKVTTEEE